MLLASKPERLTVHGMSFKVGRKRLMREYIGYLRRHKEVRKPGKVKVEEKTTFKPNIEQLDDGLSEMRAKIDCRYSAF